MQLTVIFHRRLANRDYTNTALGRVDRIKHERTEIAVHRQPSDVFCRDQLTGDQTRHAGRGRGNRFRGDLREDLLRNWVLDRFPVGDVWGVGRATACKLAVLGVTTAGQLRDMQMKQARGVNTVVLERLVAELQGVPASAVEMVEPQRKGMAVTRSFGTYIRDKEAMMGAVAQYAMRAGEKLRSHGLVAGQLTVFFHTNRHKRDRPQYQGARRITLHPMTADSLELLAAARRGIEASWKDGYEFSKAGIMLDELVTADLRPRTLFEGDVDRPERLMTAIDPVNDRFGKFSAVPAVQGFRRDWKARSDNKSPSWTTRLDEVPVVRAG